MATKLRGPADRESRRDRHPHRARGGGARAPHGDRLLRGRRRGAAHAQGGRVAARSGARGRPPISTPSRSSPRRRASGCDAIHPGYGFLSEKRRRSPAAAPPRASCSSGPAPEMLELLRRQGAGARARRALRACPCSPGTSGPTSLEEARAFLAALGERGGIMIKAIAGGGGRGHAAGPAARTSSRRRTRGAGRRRSQAFGNGDVYVERLLPARPPRRGADRRRSAGARQPPLGARVQHPAAAPEADRDGAGARRSRPGCARGSSTRRSRSAAPPGSTTSPPSSSSSTPTAATTRPSPSSRPTRACRWSTPSPRRSRGSTSSGLQLELAAGRTLPPRPRPGPGAGAARHRACRCASTWRRMARRRHRAAGGRDADRLRAAVGPGHPRRHLRLRRLPDEPALRLAARQGDRVRAIAGELGDVAAKAYRALCEFRIAGVPTNIAFLQSLLRHPDARWPAASTPGFVEEHAARAARARTPAAHRRLFFEPAAAARRVGARVDPGDPARGARPRQERASAARPRRRTGAAGCADPVERRSRRSGPENTVPIAGAHAGHHRQRRGARRARRCARARSCWSWKR